MGVSQYQKDPEKWREYARARSQKQRDDIAAIKSASGCMDCGYNEHPACLDFDHVRGEKKFNIGGGVSRGAAAILAEIEKCDIVCANCHRLRTVRRREGSLV